VKDKAILKKWWFWLIVAVVVLGAIGAATHLDYWIGINYLPDSDTNTTSDTNASQQANGDNNNSTLPTLKADDYKGKEGLIVYKELKAKGYTFDADFDKQALTDINGIASSVFEPLDPNKADDRQSVDAFVVGDLTQDGDSVKLAIVLQPTNS